MSEGRVELRLEGPVAHVTFTRPAARNSMTWAMYDGLKDACDTIAASEGVRCAVLRGAGGEAFIAGTDIGQFLDFASGEDGVDYERRIDAYLSALARLPVPTLAVIEQWAVGGGLAIASICDVRVATPGSRFGVPIARTLGNCLSTSNYARLVAQFGLPRVQRMLMLAEFIEAQEARACGYLADIVEAEALDARIAELCGRLCQHAPITMRSTKEALRRLGETEVSGEDLVRETYGSHDFRTGVEAFLAKVPPQWKGR